MEEYISIACDSNVAYTTCSPKAKATQSYVSVMSGGVGDVANDLTYGRGTNGLNYFTLTDYRFNYWSDTPTPTVTVRIAHAMDKKMDDGLPQSGSVLAALWSKSIAPGSSIVFGWAGYNIPNLASGSNAIPTTAATAGSSSTCYDNGNTANAIQQYSLSQNGGSGVNCGLAFRF